MARMDLHRLRVLLELCRLGSMHAVAEAMHTSTSTVSQQIATLAREAGTPLVEPVGRRVRLTPAGRRLADHAVTILAAVDAARLDLDPDAEPSGSVRVAGFATAIRRSLLPAVADLATTAPAVRDAHPRVRAARGARPDPPRRGRPGPGLRLQPGAALPQRRRRRRWPLWEVPWGLGVPATGRRTSRATDLAEYADHDWIVNSRNTADEEAVRTLASLVGLHPARRAPHRQPRARRGPDRRGPRRRPAPARPRRHPPGPGAAAGRPGCHPPRVRRGPPWPRALAAPPPRPRPARRRCGFTGRPVKLAGRRNFTRQAPVCPSSRPTRRRRPRFGDLGGIQKPWPRQV